MYAFQCVCVCVCVCVYEMCTSLYTEGVDGRIQYGNLKGF